MSFGDSLFGFIFVVAWIAGLVLAKGFWMTAFALFPPVSFYLVVQRIMQAMSLV